MSSNIELLGDILDFQFENIDFVDEVNKSLEKNYFVGIRNFKIPTSEGLIAFAKTLGTPLEKHNSNGKLHHLPSSGHQAEFVNTVMFKQNVNEQLRTPTQDCRNLTMHTARSYSKIKPRLFAMLMLDPGWTDNPAGFNGESLLVRWVDVMHEFREKYSSKAESDLKLLSTTRVAYNPWYINEPPDDSPILSQLSSNINDVRVRAWEDMVDKLIEKGTIQNKGYIDSLTRFCETANFCGKLIEYNMEKNFLIVLDNARVAHGRCAFIKERVTEFGIQPNPRKILAIGIL